MKTLLLILLCLAGCELEFPARPPAQHKLAPVNYDTEIKLTEQDIAQYKVILIPLE